MVDVEDRAVGCTDRCFEGLQGYCTEVERKTFERSSISGGFGKARACAGGEGIGRGPFAVGDLRPCQWYIW